MHYRHCADEHSWRDVGAYCDALIGNFGAVVEGDDVRAVLLAMSAVDSDRRAAAAGCGVVLGCVIEPGGLPFLDAVLVLLRVRLADAVVSARAWDEPVPYLLTDAGVSAVQHVG